MRNKFIKVRVAPAEYAGIARHADAALLQALEDEANDEAEDGGEAGLSDL
ncbi:hypothetical protein ACKI2N_032085 [Cupriavidus sp. 30B13]